MPRKKGPKNSRSAQTIQKNKRRRGKQNLELFPYFSSFPNLFLIYNSSSNFEFEFYFQDTNLFCQQGHKLS